ncbi:hypothetical protein MRX96_058106 [Rhipicephalus microplus]
MMSCPLWWTPLRNPPWFCTYSRTTPLSPEKCVIPLQRIRRGVVAICIRGAWSSSSPISSRSLFREFEKSIASLSSSELRGRGTPAGPCVCPVASVCMGLCGSSSAVLVAQSPLVASAAPLAHWEASMGGLCGRDRIGLQPLFHYGLNAVGRNLFEEQIAVCLDLVGREALRSSPSIERERENVGHGSDTGDGSDAGTGASNTDKMRGSADATAASVPDAPCNAPRNAANWAGARFADTTTINSDSPDQLDCMNADDFEPVDNVGPSDSTPGPSGVAEASNNIYLRPSVPHTPWFRVKDARRKKVVAEEASAMPPATLHQREHRHGAGWRRLPRLPVEHHKVIFRIRGRISLQQETVLLLRAAIQTALRAPLPLNAPIRVRKE